MRYALRRLVTSVIVVVGVMTITFGVARVVPTDPASLYAGPRARPEQVEQVREELGMNEPLVVQYVTYLGALVQGDLGVSYATRRPISEDMRSFLPATLELALLATGLSIVVGIPVGVAAAARKGSARDTGISIFAVSGVSIPVFWAALLLQLLFVGILEWLPLAGRISSETTFDVVTGFFVVDSALSGSLANVLDVLSHLILPVAVMAAYPLGLTIRLIRGSMLEVLGERHIEAARVAGIPERTILYRLALKNAIAPALTILGLTFAFSVSSAFLVEAVFNWPGLGRYLTDAIVRVDFPVIIAATLVVTVIYVVVNLLLDLVHARMDPRVNLT